MVGDFAVSQTPGYDILPEKLGGRGSSLEEAPASGEEKSGIPVAMNRRGVDFSQDKKLMESLRRDMREASPKDPWSRWDFLSCGVYPVRHVLNFVIQNVLTKLSVDVALLRRRFTTCCYILIG